MLLPALAKGPNTLGDFRWRIQDKERPTAENIGQDREGFRVQLPKPVMALEGSASAFWHGHLASLSNSSSGKPASAD